MDKQSIAIIGLGYVGLPLAVEFAKHKSVIGYDTDNNRIKELKDGIDKTYEIDSNTLKDATRLRFSSDLESIGDCNVYIVTVPTPIDNVNRPNLDPLKKATKSLGTIIKKKDIIIYESTVYPGCTEEVCVPILEDKSGLKYNEDFFCGYSPERINPGDKINTISKIKKVTSGSNPKTAEFIDNLYGEIIEAGTFKAKSIKVAEAAKVIENTQRDLNIALINELSVIFGRLDIDTIDVIEAASSKWNFIRFMPGLVGGHCIGVDPYYLTYKAEQVNYNPQVILAGRRINDNMAIYFVKKFVQKMINNGLDIATSKVAVLGVTFKENCPDIRNSKVPDIYNELKSFGMEVDVFDPHADSKQVNKYLGIKLITKTKQYDVVILTVAHEEFIELDLDSLKSQKKSVVYDLKSVLDANQVDARL